MEYLNKLIDSLSESFGEVLPRVLGAILIIIIGFILAKFIRRLVKKLLGKTNVDERLAAKLNSSVRLDSFVATLVYYLAVVYTLIIALNILGVQSVLEPLQDMMAEFVGFLPNLIGAGVIAFAGYIIATIVSQATGFLSERLEQFGGRVGLNTSSISLTNIVRQIVFIFVFIPILIVALDTLKMDAISEPATDMLRSMLSAIPKIIAAVILLGIFYIIGKYVVSIVTELLRNLGVDNMTQKLGLGNLLGEKSFSSIIGNLAMFFIMFTGIIAAADKLELTQVQVILNDVFNILGRVFFGVVILLGGLFASNLAANAISNSEGSAYMKPIVRFAILGIFLAFSLHTMGIAESIVNLAFGLTLGAIAVAFALSFGLGGREAAGKQMEHFFNKIRNEDK
jgi:hypothetical protein